MKMIRVRLVGLSGFFKLSSKPFWTEEVLGRELCVKFIIPGSQEVVSLHDVRAEDTITCKMIVLVFIYTGEIEDGNIHIFKLNDVRGS